MTPINKYKYKPTPTFFGKPYQGVYFGVELELDIQWPCCGKCPEFCSLKPQALQDTVDASAALMGDFVYFKEDGSIDGVEIVTHPASLLTHRNRWKKFFDNIPEQFKVTDNDGMHIHFTKSSLTRHQQWLIHNFVNAQIGKSSEATDNGGVGKAKPWLRRLAGRDFTHNCRRIIKPEVQLYDFAAAGKYEAVNCQPTTTVEVRLFKATTDYQEFMLRLEFVAAMVAAAMANTDPLTVDSFKKFLSAHPKRFPVLVAWLAKEKEI